MPISDAEVADAQRVTASIKEELKAILDNLSWFQIISIGVATALTIWATIATCTTLAAAIATATGPVALAAYVKCILAALERRP